jgi:Flp pilus assembly protein TadG
MRRRHGAVLVESALVLAAFLALILGVVDLGLWVICRHGLEQAARQGARQAIVHGKLATQGVWGPASVGPLQADAADPLAAAVRPFLVGFDPATVTIQADWPDGGNTRGQRVTVTVSADCRPMLLQVLGDRPLSLCASSTLRIAH